MTRRQMMSGRRILGTVAVCTAVVATAVLTQAGPAAATTPSSGKSFPTNVADVAVRSQPGTGHGSTVVKVLPAAHTEVTVSCYVSGRSVHGDRVWYHVTAPAVGYV